MKSATMSAGAIIAQCESFARKMPTFYAAIVACMVAQAIVFFGKAPLLLAVGAPLSIATVAAVRMVWWLRRRTRPFTEAEARESLARSKLILFLSTGIIVVMDVITFRYLDEGARTFLMIELFGCSMTGVYCLMHIRQAAYVMAGALLASLVFTLQTFPTEAAIGIGIAIVSLVLAMSYAMQSYHDDFISLIRTKDENQRLANIDMLTDLPNRRQFFHDLDVSCAAAKRSGRRVAVAIADLDGFKPINDAHGHGVGDRVLRAIAERIAQGGTIFGGAYRLGGDEFALIAIGFEDAADMLAEADEMIRAIGEPVALGDLIVSTGCSVGIAIFPESASTPELLYERADYALYHVKRSGRNKARVFTEEHEQQLRVQGAIEQALRSADLAEEFYLLYQPIVRTSDGEPLGFECLARWLSPALGEVSPSAFIPVAEQSGLIASLTPVLLRKALSEALAWPAHLKVSFNLSPHDIASRERTLAVIGIIGNSGIDPRRVDLELTETALLHSFEVVRENMHALKSIGVNISLDDFGTGYSSLSHVHALPLDKIKIDRSFVRDLEGSLPSRTIVRSMITLCRDLNMSCVVEGVETGAQVEALSDLGCEQIQGYFFAKPMTAPVISDFLARSKRSAA